MLHTLPQETVNEIIAHLRGEERALQSLSIVAKRFTEECRRHLFASIYIGTKFTRWCDAIPPGEGGLSRYVRLLDMDTTMDGWTNLPLTLRIHLVHLRSFTQVEHLKICPLNLHKFSKQDLVDYFGHFSTVRSIYIRPTGGRSAVLNFLTLFPLLETTVIASPLAWGVSEESVNPPNLVCRGDLVLKACRIDGGENILSCLTLPTTRYRRLGLGLVNVVDPTPFERLLETCGSSLESIQFICCFFVHCPETLLSPLTELRDIALSLRCFHDYDVIAILASITSTKVNSVTLFIWDFPSPGDLDDFSLRWTKIESALCRLTELKKRAKSLDEVVLDVYFDDEKLATEVSVLSEGGGFMPRFREGGVVNIRTQPVDLALAMLSIVPEEFK